MHHELLVAKEAFHLLKRDPKKYRRRVAGFYLLSLKDREIGAIARASYFFIRHLDDVLDGDQVVSFAPLAYTQDLRAQVSMDSFTGSPSVGGLAEFAIDRLKRRGKPGDNPRRDFLDSIDSMVFDHQRAKGRSLLSAAEVEAYYGRIFLPVINIMLIGVRSQLRASDIPELALSQGRVYSVRDLENDWRAGVINIPREVLGEAGLRPYYPVGDVTINPVVRNWNRKQLEKGKEELAILQTKLALAEPLTRTVCNYLTGPMHRVINNYQ